jgi:hypothetical protein
MLTLALALPARTHTCTAARATHSPEPKSRCYLLIYFAVRSSQFTDSQRPVASSRRAQGAAAGCWSSAGARGELIKNETPAPTPGSGSPSSRASRHVVAALVLLLLLITNCYTSNNTARPALTADSTQHIHVADLRPAVGGLGNLGSGSGRRRRRPVAATARATATAL